MKRFKKPSDIRCAVVGYGGQYSMGAIHLNEMKKAGMVPTAVVEIDPKRLACAAEDFPGIETYGSVTAMLKKSDAKLIALITPHNTHAPLALQCLKAGRSVVCEKPFAITTVECDRMIAAARKNNVMVSTYHNRHWDGCILQAVDKIVRKKVIGDVFRIDAHVCMWAKPLNWWRTSKTISGGILYDWGVHLLEYSLQMLTSDIVEVTGFAKTGFWDKKSPWKQDTNEDEGSAVVRFKDGTWLTLTISQIESNPREGALEITGTKGSYIMSHRDWTVIRCKENGQKATIKGKNPKGQSWQYYQNVADHMTKGKKLVITPEWARRPIHILDLAGKSAKQGKSLKAKYK